MILFFKKHHDRIINAILWLIVLLPLVGCALLMKKYCVDQRFLDDWVWAGDLVKFKEGTPPGGTSLLHDIFSVHLEHRPALPRALALGVTLLAKGDVQAQNGLTLLWMASSFGALCWLWVRRAGLSIREAWMPLLLAGGVMFTPVQWQNLLWPLCCETMMPFLFLLLSLCCAFKTWPWWGRAFAGGVFAILGMLSFASGVLLWVLPLPVFVFCGVFASNRQRWLFATLWGAIFGLTMVFYLQVRIVSHDRAGATQKHLASLPGKFDLVYDLHNEVPPQYAYHHGEEDKMGESLGYVLRNPVEALQFLAVFSGGLTVRGWAADTKDAALVVGSIYLAGLALLLFCCWRFRKDRELLSNLLPMLCLGVYTPATGMLVAIGRLYAGHVYSALNTRYHIHQTQIVIALVGAAFFLARHFFRDRPSASLRPVFVAVGGAVAGVVGVGWFFGSGMMEAWQCARLRNQAAQFVSQVFRGGNDYVGWVAGSQEMVQTTAAKLAKHDLLRRPPLRTGKFSELDRTLRVHERTLDDRHALIHRLYRDDSGRWKVEGYASLLVTNRLADGVLFAWRVPGGEWTLWGFSQPSGAPPYLPRAMGKDMWGVVPRYNIWPPRAMCQLDELVAVSGEPPPGAEISAWVMDMLRRRLYRVTRSKNGRATEAGISAEEFAKPYDGLPDDVKNDRSKDEE